MPLTMKWLRPRLGKARRPEKQRGMLPDEHKLDEQTGQVYTEITASATEDLDRDWPYELCASYDSSGRIVGARGRKNPLRGVIQLLKKRGNSRDESKVMLKTSNAKGARSLFDSVFHVILQNLDDLTVEALSGVPAILLQQIWDEIKKRQLISFHVWQVFSTLLAGHDASLQVLKHRDQISKPKSPLRFYTDPLTSNSFEFLTYLSITTTFAVPELVKLAAIKNLVALEIVSEDGKSEHGVSDRIVRAWSIAAATENAFSVLRILKLWKHPLVTNASIAYIGEFPALAVYDVTGCGFDLKESVKAGGFGWIPTVNPNVLGLFEAACVERATVMRAALGKESRPVRQTPAKQISDDAVVTRLPRAEIAEFLTRDERTCRQSPKALEARSLLDIEPSVETKKQRRRGRVFTLTHEEHPMIPFLTWDFLVYTKICKIGELRNDGDLKRAGIEVGDQPMVDSDLICPVPIVSFRIGPTPISLLYTNRDAPPGGFYRNTNSIAESLHRYARTWKEPVQAQRLTFTRIKYDFTEMLPASIKQALKPSGNSHGHRKRPSTAGERPTSSGNAAPAKRRSMGPGPGLARKKKSLGDVLSSFMA